MRRLGLVLLTVLAVVGGVAAPDAVGETKPKEIRCARHAHQLENHPEKFLHCEAPRSSGGAERGDFNADGFGDLAIGVPGEDVGTAADAGAIHVLYGSANGLTAAGNQFFTAANPRAGARLGSALAAGDFDSDGFSDLAFSAPGGAGGAGVVAVFYGSPMGLSTADGQAFFGDEAGDAFGSSLVWADFGKTSEADLAIGVPGEDVGAATDAGEVQVLYGTSSGLTTVGKQIFRQGSDGLADSPETGDRFGSALAGADFQATGEADLAIGVPLEDVGPGADAGVVQVINGSPAGLVASASVMLTFLFAGVGDEFGFALAAGNIFNTGDAPTKAELVVGAPFSDGLSGVANSGDVTVFLGAPSGFPASAIPPPPDGRQVGDQTGRSVAANDFDGDGLDDLAVGIPFEDIERTTGTIFDAGAVMIMRGVSGVGATITGVLQQNPPESGNQFGAALSAWNFGNGPQADLAIGVPFDNLPLPVFGGQVVDAGAINVAYGSATGLPVSRFQVWTQNSPDVLDSAQANDQFGSMLY
jgi:hypothetical protein